MNQPRLILLLRSPWRKCLLWIGGAKYRQLKFKMKVTKWIKLNLSSIQFSQESMNQFRLVMLLHFPWRKYLMWIGGAKYRQLKFKMKVTKWIKLNLSSIQFSQESMNQFRLVMLLHFPWRKYLMWIGGAKYRQLKFKKWKLQKGIKLNLSWIQFSQESMNQPGLV